MKEIQLELLDRLKKVHSENNMPDNIKIIPLELNDDLVIRFNITMTPEQCKDWSYIFTGDENLEYEGFEKDFKYNDTSNIFSLFYTEIITEIITITNLQDS